MGNGPRPLSLLRNTRVLIVITAVLIGAAVWVAATIQRDSADNGRARQAEAQALLTGMLDMETGFRGFEITGHEEFLEPYRSGRVGYANALAALRQHTSGLSARELETADRAAQRWQELAGQVVADVRLRGPRAVTVAGAEQRKAVFDRFRTAHGELAATLESERQSRSSTAGIVTAVVSLLLALLIGYLGDLLVGRRERAAREQRQTEARYRETQTEFAETMQLAEDEQEAHDLLQRHLERSIPGSQVTVFNRNHSQDRLEPTTRVADPALAERLEGATPRSCLAVRLGRASSREPGDRPLMECELCGALPGATTCRPLVVGTEVIGSVLATHQQPLDHTAHDRLRDSVAQAAPALANLRNLALAELRAATDALTGLPNRRAIEDTLKRMVAQASRTMQPLTVLLLDLDHFKTINDLYGHEHGDEALAATGALLRDSLRESDFAGRQGGEEFIVLAPATTTEGGAVLAENLRAAIEALDIPGLDHRVTASIGVATFPDMASNGTGVVRLADRALYAAKERGRNRVEIGANSGGAQQRAPA